MLGGRAAARESRGDGGVVGGERQLCHARASPHSSAGSRRDNGAGCLEWKVHSRAAGNGGVSLYITTRSIRFLTIRRRFERGQRAGNAVLQIQGDVQLFAIWKSFHFCAFYFCAFGNDKKK